MTEGGFTRSIRLERIGRVGMLWNHAKHVIVYERTVKTPLRYRGEDPEVPIRPLHKMTEWQAKREMAAVGLEWKETRQFLPSQHFMVYVKPAE